VSLDLEQKRQQAHALLDLLSPSQLSAVRNLLEVMVDDEELTEEERVALQVGRDSL
jgi:hypothetical protein